MKLGARGLFRLVAVAASWALLAASSCAAEKEQTAETGEGEVVTSDPYIRLTDDTVSALGEKIDAVQIGDRWSSLNGVLGSPTSTKSIILKKTDDVTGTLRTYYVRKQSEHLVNESTDIYVKLVFSTEDVLVGISSNIPGHERAEGDPYGAR